MNKRLLFIFLLSIMLFFISGCEYEPASFSGRVIDLITGEPIANANITYTLPVEAFGEVVPVQISGKNLNVFKGENMPSISERWRTVSTNADGFFFSDEVLPYHPFPISISAPDYTRRSIDILVHYNEKYLLEDVKLCPKSHIVEVGLFVEDSNGIRVEGAEISIIKKDDIYYPKEVYKTFETGSHYVFFEPGIYEFKVSKEGYETKTIDNINVSKDDTIVFVIKK